MTGFDLPPIRGFDRSFQPLRPQGPGEPFRSPELQGPQVQSPPDQVSAFEAMLPADVRGGGSADALSGGIVDAIDHVRGLQNDAKDKVRAMVMGEDVELHDVMIAGNKSEVAFNLLLEVRNKLVDAWEKLSRSS
ncbi:MAG TPA: hypothetical protein ENI87_08200, partial [bacterium]|nr:hypothetical protein [bacterium]